MRLGWWKLHRGTQKRSPCPGPGPLSAAQSTSSSEPAGARSSRHSFFWQRNIRRDLHEFADLQLGLLIRPPKRWRAPGTSRLHIDGAVAGPDLDCGTEAPHWRTRLVRICGASGTGTAGDSAGPPPLVEKGLERDGSFPESWRASGPDWVRAKALGIPCYQTGAGVTAVLGRGSSREFQRSRKETNLCACRVVSAAALGRLQTGHSRTTQASDKQAENRTGRI